MNKGSSLSIAVSRTIILAALSSFAAATIVTQVAQIINLPFYVYAIVGAVLGVVALIGAAILGYRVWISTATIRDTETLIGLLGLGLIGATLAIVIVRPNIDDFYYVPNVIYYLQHPATPVSFEVHFVYSDFAIFSPTWATATPFEYAQSIIAYFFNVEYLTVFHIWMPAIVGFFIPIIYFTLLGHFTDKTWDCLFGALIMICVVQLLGDTGRAPANFAFARIFEGKAFLLTAGLPLLTIFSIDHFKKPGVVSAGALCVASICMAGATASAVVILPCMAIGLGIAWFFSTPFTRQSFITLATYFASFFYLAVFAITLLPYAQANLGLDSIANQGWPTTFWGQIVFFINPQSPITPVTVIASIALALLGLKGELRKFLFIWLLAAFVLFLNPLVGDLVIRYVATPNLYWRLFYILPFPLAIGINVVTALAYLRSHHYRLLPISAITLMVVLALYVPLWKTSVFYARNGSRLGWAEYKLDSQDLATSRKIITVVPPGVMLAPIRIGGALSMLTSNYLQMNIRGFAEQLWLGPDLAKNDAAIRLQAANYLNGDDPSLSALEAIVSRYSIIRAVVAVRSRWNDAAFSSFIASQAFTHQQEVGPDIIVAWK